MPAVSKKQQKFFGIVRAIQKGEQAPTTPETAKAAADMKKGDVKKFASTKHKGLPEKKVTKEGYGNPNVGPALKMARLIDKTKPGPRSKRTKISQYLKRREMDADKKKFAAMGEEVKISEDKQIKKIVKQLRKSVKSHAKQADTLEKKIEEGSLHKWFKGSKSKDGKGGWVNVVTGGTCASDEPGEGTPKCVSSSKRASMSKSERLSAARRKKKADPGQQSKSGAAKPTYVSTDSPRKKKMKEEVQLTEVKDKKGKGSGSKDACYHKVKSRYSVWPSAYASGALVKCRKVGAANWGNSSKKEEFEPTGISFQQFQEKCWKGYEKKGMKTMFGKRYPNCVKKEEVEVVEAKYEAGASTYGKATIRNKRKFGTSGELPDPLTGKKITKDATRGELIAKRREEHKTKRGMKEELNIVEDDMKGMSVKSGHKRPTKSGAGMTQKGVEAYRRKNPGSKLKTAVTTEPSKLKKGSKAANRRKSYCARSAGQMKKFPKAAKDPDSRLRQARRRWNC